MSELANNPASTFDGLALVDAPLSPGRQLAAARQSQGWSVEQVATQLKLAPRQIEAIEADRLEALPSMMVARGFIGTYARLLKIDAAPLLARVTADVCSPIESIRRQGDLSAPFSETRLPSMYRDRVAPNRKGALLLVLALVLAGGAWGIQQAGWWSVLPEGLSAVVGGQPAAQIAEPAADPVELAAGNRAGDTGAAGSVAKPDLIELVDTGATAAKSVPVQAPAEAVPVAAAAPTATDDDVLSLVLRQDSWIEIKREDGSVVVARLAKAGTTETFKIVEPVLLVVGNAGGVDASLRNIPLDLKTGASSNVARINLK